MLDFQKAYDTIPPACLWRKLERVGVHARVLRAIQTLHANIPMLVRGAKKGSVLFQSRLGLKQGCPLSLLLFGMYWTTTRVAYWRMPKAMTFHAWGIGHYLPPPPLSLRMTLYTSAVLNRDCSDR